MPHKFPAMVVEILGNAPVLHQIELPHPEPDQVIVSTRACGLNFADLLMIDGSYQDTPPVPFVPGMEVAGEIIEIGQSVTGFSVGDRIAAFSGKGGLAAGLAVDAGRCVRLPDALDDVAASGFPIAYGTSHLALTHRARLAPGETLVVLGAGGGVGLTAVEIGRHLGARVIAVARGADKLDAARQAGATEVIDSAETPDMLSALRDLGSVDVLYDPVGGALAETAHRALRPEGRHLVIGFASGDLPTFRPNHMMVKNTCAIGFYWGGYLAFQPELLTNSLKELANLLADGTLTPHIGNVLPFSRALEGLDLLRRRQATGKVVVTL